MSSNTSARSWRGKRTPDREAVLLVNPELPGLVEHLDRLRRALKGTHRLREQAMPAFDFDWTDPTAAAALDETVRTADVVVFLGLTPGQLDVLFRLRLSQLVRGAPVIPARSVVVLYEGAGAWCPPRGFAARARAAWPFAAADFVTLDAPLGEAIAAAIGLPVPVRDPEGVAALARDREPAALRVDTAARPTIALMVQPLGGRCGSTTAFENQIEELVDAGHFVLRVFLNEMESDGATMARNWRRNVRENSVNCGAHIDAAAVMPTPRELETGVKPSGYEQFVNAIVGRYRCRILDPAVADAARHVGIVVMNHVISAGFVLRHCPEARILLDTHDYFTRWAFKHARDGTGDATFERRGELLRMARLEAELWRIPDVCTNVSLGERLRVARANPKSVIVLPRPYVAEAADPGPGAEWDVLISGDSHAFNVGSLRWFLETVLPRHPALRDKRIAVAGRIFQQFDAKAIEATSGVRFLGFVDDLEALRARSRVTLVPDRAGTGIAVKTLTALAASHPVVSTDVGLRGFDDVVRRILPAHADGDALAADLLALLDDPALLGARRAASGAAYRAVLGGWSYTTALADADAPDTAMLARRRAVLSRVADLAAARAPAPEPDADADREFTFRLGGSATPLLSAGWHHGEIWGRWMDGATSRLSFAGLANPASLTSIEIEALSPAEPVELELTLNGHYLGRHMIHASTAHASYPVPDHVLAKDEAWEIRLRASRAFRAADQDPRADGRVLGVGLVRLGLEPSSHYVPGTEIRTASEEADHVLRDGWQGREEWGRWMEGAEARLELFLNNPVRQPHTLVLDLMPCSAGGSLSLVVNGVALPERPVIDGTSRWPLPRAATEGRSLIQITLRSSAVWRPSDHTDFERFTSPRGRSARSAHRDGRGAGGRAGRNLPPSWSRALFRCGSGLPPPGRGVGASPRPGGRPRVRRGSAG